MMNTTANTYDPTDDEISLVEIWQTLKHRAWLIITTTVISGGVAAGISTTMTPIYRAETVLAVVEQGGTSSGGLAGLAGQFGGLASLTGVSLGGSADRSEALGTLSSKQLVESFIKERDLLPVLYANQWNLDSKQWRGDDKPPTVWAATELFTKRIRKVAEDKKSGLITVAVEWRDAQQSAAWANDLVSRANASLRARAIAKSEANLAYLNAELGKTSMVEIRQAMFRLIESEVKGVMIAQGTNDYAFKVIDPAVTPERKIKPKRTLITAVGLALGLIFSSFWALMRGERKNSN